MEFGEVKIMKSIPIMCFHNDFSVLAGCDDDSFV